MADKAITELEKSQELQRRLSEEMERVLKHPKSYWLEEFKLLVTDMITSNEDESVWYGTFLTRFGQQIDVSMMAPAGVYYNMAVDDKKKSEGYTLVINPAMFALLSRKEQIAVLKHEVSHVMNLHFFRMTPEKGYTNHQLNNIAMDIAINGSKINPIIPNLPGSKGFEDSILTGMFVEYLDEWVDAGKLKTYKKDMNAEYYYTLLKQAGVDKELEEQQGQQNQQGQGCPSKSSIEKTTERMQNNNNRIGNQQQNISQDQIDELKKALDELKKINGKEPEQQDQNNQQNQEDQENQQDQSQCKSGSCNNPGQSSQQEQSEQQNQSQCKSGSCNNPGQSGQQKQSGQQNQSQGGSGSCNNPGQSGQQSQSGQQDPSGSSSPSGTGGQPQMGQTGSPSQLNQGGQQSGQNGKPSQLDGENIENNEFGQGESRGNSKGSKASDGGIGQSIKDVKKDSHKGQSGKGAQVDTSGQSSQVDPNKLSDEYNKLISEIAREMSEAIINGRLKSQHIDDHSLQETNKPENVSNETFEKMALTDLQEMIRTTTKQNGRGFQPAEVDNCLLEISKRLKTQIRWEKVLRRSLGNILSRRREVISPRVPHLLYPEDPNTSGKVRGKDPLVTVIMDVSGSMSDEEIIMGVNEVKGVARKFGADVKLVQVDTMVHEVTNVTESLKKVNRSAAGGTYLQPGFEFIMDPKNKMGKPQVIICITDGGCEHDFDSDFELPKDVKVIWLATQGLNNLAFNVSKYPNMKAIHLDLKKFEQEMNGPGR